MGTLALTVGLGDRVELVEGGAVVADIVATVKRSGARGGRPKVSLAIRAPQSVAIRKVESTDQHERGDR